MPAYRFNVNGDFISDLIKLRGVADAKREAIRLAGRIISDELPESFWKSPEWTMTVTSESGLTLFRLTFSGAGAQ